MSQTALFIAGVVIFAITVAGSVLAGGLMMTRRQLDQEEDMMRLVDRDDLARMVPRQLKY